MVKFPFLKKEKTSLLLDIGTTFVKALIFKKSEGKTVVLQKSFQELEKGEIFQNWDFNQEVAEKMVGGAMKNLRKERNLSEMFFNLPAHILKERIADQNFLRKNSEKNIDEKEEKEIIEKIKLSIRQQIAEETGLLAKDVYCANWKILEKKINGYEVDDFRGRRGNCLEFKILFVFLPRKYFAFLEKTGKSFGFSKINLVFKGLKFLHFFPAEQEGVFLDIGGEVTQIFLKKSGKLEKIDELEMGGENFSQALAYNLGITLPESRTLKDGYCRKKVGEGVRQRIAKIFAPIADDWFQNLKWKLKNYKILLPAKFFLFGGAGAVPELGDIIERGNWNGVPFISSPEAEILYPRSLSGWKDQTHKINSPQDTATLICIL